MDMPHPEQPPAPEILAERRGRIAWEAERIAEARASAAAGDVVSFEAIETWVNSWGTDNELPKPLSQARR